MRPFIAVGFFVLLLFGWLMAGGCAKNEDASYVEVCTEDIETVSLSEHLMPVFIRSCARCHRREGGNHRATADGRFYDQKGDILGLVGTFIIPGKPEDSGLLSVLNQTYTIGKRKIVMPPRGTRFPKWSKNELALMEKWIVQGAKESD